MPDMLPDALNPFAPLPGLIGGIAGKDQAGGPAPKKAAEIWNPQLPAPCEPPEAGSIRHYRYGVPSRHWIYRDEAGEPQFVTCRFDLPPADDGTPQKEVLPYSYGRRRWSTKAGKQRDETGWHFKRPALPVPLYGLDRLAMKSDATVLVVEGEKKADAAAFIFPDVAAMASQGGSKAPDKANWTPLAGHHVVIWPDNDQPGRDYAAAVAQLAPDAGALSAKIVAVPETWPDKWDLADSLPDGVLVETLHAMLADARPFGIAPDAGSDDQPDLDAAAKGQPEVLPEERAQEIERLSWLWTGSRSRRSCVFSTRHTSRAAGPG